MGTLVWIDRFAFLGVLALAFWFFGCYFKRKSGEGSGKYQKVELDYEIFYQGKRISDGYFELEDGESYRFGFSDKREYHNNVVLNKYFGRMEDEEEVEDLEEEYNAWFELRREDKKIILRPTYSRAHRGHKNIYLEGRKLDKEGELFKGDVLIFARENNENSLKIRIYDYNKL